MPEGRSPISSARISTGDVARHSFAIVRRGYDIDEVKTYLQSVARSIEVLEQREQELREAVAEADERAAHPVVDEATLTASLGTARTSRQRPTWTSTSADMPGRSPEGVTSSVIRQG